MIKIEQLQEYITEDIKGLIFDLDGTLADTLPLHFQAWQSTGVELGFDVTDQMIRDYSGTPTEKVAEILNEKYNWQIDPRVIASTKLDFYQQHKKAQGKIKAIDLLLELAKGYHNILPMSVGTGSRRKNAIISLEDIDALHLFKTVVTASDVKNPKPHPETFLTCARNMGVSPAECLVFEDGAMGIKAAIDGGMKLVDVKPYLL